MSNLTGNWDGLEFELGLSDRNTTKRGAAAAAAREPELRRLAAAAERSTETMLRAVRQIRGGGTHTFSTERRAELLGIYSETTELVAALIEVLRRG